MLGNCLFFRERGYFVVIPLDILSVKKLKVQHAHVVGNFSEIYIPSKDIYNTNMIINSVEIYTNTKQAFSTT